MHKVWILLLMIISVFVRAQSQKIYSTNVESRADLKIYFTDVESRAGWRNPSKKYLIY